MKRYVRAWYTGEPSDYNKKGHSVYSNPKNYQEKQKEVLQFLGQLTPTYPGFFRPNATPSVVQVQSKLDKKKYFKFDLWEDEQPIDEQEDDFIIWAEEYAYKDPEEA